MNIAPFGEKCSENGICCDLVGHIGLHDIKEYESRGGKQRMAFFWKDGDGDTIQSNLHYCPFCGGDLAEKQ